MHEGIIVKKILHFVRTNIFSGLESTVLNICTLVPGYQQAYVSPSGVIDDYLSAARVKHIVVQQLTPRIVRQVIQQYQPDIVQGHDVVASLCLAVNAPYCSRRHIKIISQLHNNDPRMQHLTSRSLLYAASSGRYDQVIGVSQSILDEFLFKKCIAAKFRVIANVIDPQRIQQQLTTVPTITKRWDCLFIGRLVEQKQPLKFIAIIAELKKIYPQIQAAMLGAGSLLDQVQQAIRQNNLQENITVLGFQTNQYPYLQATKLLIIPSSYEGFGLVALESLLLAKPVIATPVGGLVNIVDSRCGALVQTKAEFVTAISQLLKSSTLYHQKSTAAVQKAQQINRIDRFQQQFSAVYQ